MAQTIAEKLDRQFPARCSICGQPLKRTEPHWNICPRCGHDNTGTEEWLIQKTRR